MAGRQIIIAAFIVLECVLWGILFIRRKLEAVCAECSCFIVEKTTPHAASGLSATC